MDMGLVKVSRRIPHLHRSSRLVVDSCDSARVSTKRDSTSQGVGSLFRLLFKRVEKHIQLFWYGASFEAASWFGLGSG